jgi:acyl-CoA synthetase (AMP-forming)/AMP-acid ligase II
VTALGRPGPGLTDRRALAADPRAGAGTLLGALAESGADLDAERVSLGRPWTRPDGGRAEAFALRALIEAVDLCARWYAAHGVRPRDPVAVWSRDAGAVGVHYFALTRLGAIPALINGRLPADRTRAYVERIGAVGLLADADLLAGGAFADARGLLFAAPLDGIAAHERDPLPDWYPYAHGDDDPVLISHSSGTTAAPKAVMMTHGTLFAAVRYRLRLPLPSGFERILSAVPATHNSGVTLLLLALANGVPIRLLSEHDPATVAGEVERFRPSFVGGFAGTFADLSASDLSGRDLASVALWWNSGDAAHEAHVRPLLALGSHVEVDASGRRVVPGSLFIDGLGSSEMGHSLFYNVHGREPDTFGRCVGRTYEFARAAVLSRRGDPLPAHQVGMLGVKSPTLTPGYWNDSLTTHRARLRGWWLTGDLVYRDDEGRFFHVDRWSDAIRTEQGMLYSLLAEERILAACAELRDCTVVGSAGEDGRTEVWALLVLKASGAQGAGAPGAAAPAAFDEDAWRARLGALLRGFGMPGVQRVKQVSSNELRVGPTGKVRKRELREWLGSADGPFDPLNPIAGAYE